jgi:hypothetical protein
MAEQTTTEEIQQSGFARGSRWTPEKRAEQSEMVKRLHAEGRFGGAEFGRLGAIAKAQRNAELHEVVLEQSRRDARLLYDQLRSIALTGKSNMDRVAAIKQIDTMVQAALKSPPRLDGSSIEDLVREFAQASVGTLEALLELVTRMIDDAKIVDADVVDDDVAA